jgi:tetratricopeptide (TPR) repeat protein
VAELAEPHLQGPDQASWLDQLEAEHDNFRAALRWALRTGSSRDATELAVRLAAALAEFWWPRGHVREGQHFLAVALDRGTLVEPALRAKALYHAGELAYAQSDNQLAMKLLEQSLALYHRLADKRGTACVLRALGSTLVQLDDVAQAETCYAESLALFRAVGDAWGVAWLLFHLAEHEPAIDRQVALLDESLAVARAGGYQRPLVHALNLRALLERDQGNCARAMGLLEESLVISRALRDVWVTAMTLTYMTLIAIDQQDGVRARSLSEQALVLQREAANKTGTALALATLGDLLHRQGDHARADTLLEESVAMSRDLGDQGALAITLNILGTAARGRHDHAQAARHYRESLQLSRRPGDERLVADILKYLGYVAQAEGNNRRAARLFGAMEALVEHVGGASAASTAAEYERHRGDVGNGLGDAAFGAACAEGRAMTLEQAIAYALEETGPE